MARETYINPQSFVIFKETGIVPTVPDPVTLRKFHADFLDTDLEVGTWARNVKDGKLWYRNETEILEFEDDLFGPGSAAYHNHDDIYYTKTELQTEGSASIHFGNITNVPTSGILTDWFEIVNEGLADEYLRCKKPFSGDYEIQAWTDEGQFPGTIWESMPVATVSSVGGFQLDNNATHFYNGTGNWVAITSGIFDHAGLQHLAYADSGHTGFAPTIHNFIDTTNHPVSGLTAGHFLRALSATTYGFESVAVAYVTGTPENNQIAVWTNANTIEGTSGITYDGTTFAITGNITATGEISAFTGDGPASWWGDIPSVLGSAGEALVVNSTEDGLEWGTPAGGMSWPGSAGIAVYSGSSSWGTSLSISNNTNNYIVTMTGSGFNGEQYLTWDGSKMVVGSPGTITWDRVLTVGGSGIWCQAIEMPDNTSIFIASTADSGGRIKIHHNTATGHAYFDYYENLYFRSGASSSATKITFYSSGNIETVGTVTATGGNSGNWNTAYGWGNHAGLYSVTSHNHSGTYDPAGTAAAAVSSHTSTYNHSNYNTAYGWGNHASAGYAANNQTFYLGTTQIAINRGSGAISLTGITSIDGTAASTPKLLTTNFTIEESGGKLIVKYGATTIGSISSAGYLKMKDESEAFVSSP